MSEFDENRLRAGEIKLIGRKRRRALKKKGRIGETRWSWHLGSYVRHVKCD